AFDDSFAANWRNIQKMTERKAELFSVDGQTAQNDYQRKSITLFTFLVEQRKRKTTKKPCVIIYISGCCPKCK
ncbi:MAG: hypothetical protein ACI4J8_02775, partial [Oscillospiraceae bacterium]